MAESAQASVVRAWFDAFNRRDVDALLALSDPAIELHAPTAWLTRGGRPYRGHGDLRAYLHDVATLWEELRAELRELHERGDTVVALGRVYAWGDGRVVDAPAGWLWRTRGGRVVHGRVFETEALALEALGPSS